MTRTTLVAILVLSSTLLGATAFAVAPEPSTSPIREIVGPTNNPDIDPGSVVDNGSEEDAVVVGSELTLHLSTNLPEDATEDVAGERFEVSVNGFHMGSLRLGRMLVNVPLQEGDNTISWMLPPGPLTTSLWQVTGLVCNGRPIQTNGSVAVVHVTTGEQSTDCSLQAIRVWNRGSYRISDAVAPIVDLDPDELPSQVRGGYERCPPGTEPVVQGTADDPGTIGYQFELDATRAAEMLASDADGDFWMSDSTTVLGHGGVWCISEGVLDRHSNVRVSLFGDSDRGPQPTLPVQGTSCWDLNENGVKDVESEDTNHDGVVDVRDCQGTAGQDATQCWDLNENGVKDLEDQDLDGDGEIDIYSEDTNNDGVVDVRDCRSNLGDRLTLATYAMVTSRRGALGAGVQVSVERTLGEHFELAGGMSLGFQEHAWDDRPFTEPLLVAPFVRFSREMSGGQLGVVVQHEGLYHFVEDRERLGNSEYIDVRVGVYTEFFGRDDREVSFVLVPFIQRSVNELEPGHLVLPGITAQLGWEVGGKTGLFEVGFGLTWIPNL